jgi:hypothetical protein
MSNQVHEPDEELLSGSDAIEDARRLRGLLFEFGEVVGGASVVEVRVPLSALFDAIDRLSDDELKLLERRLKERLGSR